MRAELLRHEVFVESMGGEVLDVEVSATKGTNLDKLLEAILLQAEVLDLKANPDRTAEGVVIEAKLEKGRGAVATVLVQTGTLMIGDIIVAGSEWGRVRALLNDRGEQLKEAGPSQPVEVLGLQGTPPAGDRFAAVESEARAREITEYRQRLARDKAVAKHAGAARFARADDVAAADERAEGIPAGHQGRRAGLGGSDHRRARQARHRRGRARIVHSGAGAITESDVSLAETSGAAIIGFNVRANPQARAGGRTAPASKSATTTSSTISWMT